TRGRTDLDREGFAIPLGLERIDLAATACRRDIVEAIVANDLRGLAAGKRSGRLLDRLGYRLAGGKLRLLRARRRHVFGINFRLVIVGLVIVGLILVGVVTRSQVPAARLIIIISGRRHEDRAAVVVVIGGPERE